MALKGKKHGPMTKTDSHDADLLVGGSERRDLEISLGKLHQAEYSHGQKGDQLRRSANGVSSEYAAPQTF